MTDAALPQADEDAIRRVVVALHEAFAARDAQAFLAHLADDADWENAFGRRAHGRTEIEALLTRVFPMFSGAEIVETEMRIAPVTRDVAVADSIRTVTGQTTSGGEPMPARRVRTSIVFRKDGDRWLAVVYRVADLRDPSESR